MFSQRGNLVRHKRIYKGKKPFKCHICDKAFSHSSSLARHTNIHVGEKPYQWEICEKTFIERGALLDFIALG